MLNTIYIDIYLDTICPWCYIGHNKLKNAILNFPEFKFHLIWRPYQLNSNIALEGMDRQKYLELKFDGKENAKKIYESINKEGIKNNIHFQFQKITLTPNSFASHKLIALAHKYNKQTAVVETLFYAYFIEGINIGNLEQLIIIAKQHKIYDKNTFEYLQSQEDRESLLSEAKHAHELGIKGVPCFIINKEIVLYGAQDKNVFIDIFEKLKDE